MDPSYHSPRLCGARSLLGLSLWKGIAVYQEKPKPQSQKLLASSLAAHAVSATHVEQQIAEDAALALSLQLEQATDLREKGVTVIPLVQPLQTMPSSLAGPSSSSVQAPAPTLIAPSSAPAEKSIPPPPEKKKMLPPPPKVQLKRVAPAEKELDPAAKRQKIQQSLTAKASRVVVKRKEEEERRRKSEKEERLRTARIRKVEERAAMLWDEVRLIQSTLIRSAYILFTPEESDACATQADIDACGVTIKEMIDSGRYAPEEFDIIRKTVNKRTPQFNLEKSERFNRMMKELSGRSAEEIEARRAIHPDACEIEKFISKDLLGEWMECKEKFIKAYYFWQVVPFQEECSKLDGLNNFMCMCYEELRRKIFVQPELAEPMKKIIIVPEKK